MCDAGQRSEAVLVLVLAGGGERAERATVKGIAEGDDALSLGLTFGVKVPARELQSGFDRLGARVAEKSAIHARQPAQLFGQAHVGLVVKIVRDVEQLARLFGDGLGKLGVRVAQGADGNARIHVEVTLARYIPQLAALPAREHERRLAVV